MRLLVVDDIEVNRFLIEEAFHDQGLEIETATNGEEALDKFSALRPEVVLLDVQMPGIDGIETSRRMKAAAGPYSYVLLLSGYSDVADAQDLERSRADGFIAKPYSMEDLRSAVDRGLAAARARRG